ncbi:hypothetical protein FOA43_002754 [Brettanomyces nanus]|uniref:HECT-type E3 ubiquitin transferase n=1 Tax=Eeniella nana TaxID=13502 RepID=A0A875RPS5_EENNA|nr:uncharacterized protein FOA43_002754 [Brettanomyces nanus]QPG75400.1 hypothetical protein FOA43_002754 [Brettanomyces nanus]
MSFNFTGTTRQRNINLGNRSLVGRNRASFLQTTERERKRREQHRKEVHAATTIQSAVRSYLDLDDCRQNVSRNWAGDLAVFRFFFPFRVAKQSLEITQNQVDLLDANFGDGSSLIDNLERNKLASCLVDSIHRVYTYGNGQSAALISRLLQSLNKFINNIDEVDLAPLFRVLFDLQSQDSALSSTFCLAILRYGSIHPDSTLLSLLSSNQGEQLVNKVVRGYQITVIDPFLRAQMREFPQLNQTFSQLPKISQITYLGNMAGLLFTGGESHYRNLIDDTTIRFWGFLLKHFEEGVVFTSDDDDDDLTTEMDIESANASPHLSGSVSIPPQFNGCVSNLYLTSFPRLVLVHCGESNFELFTSFLYAMLQFIAPQSAKSKNATNTELQNSLVIELIVASSTNNMLNKLYREVSTKIDIPEDSSSQKFMRTVFQPSYKTWWMSLYIFEEMYSYILSVSHDADLFGKGRLTKAKYLSFVKFLKRLVVLAVLDFRSYRKQNVDLPLLNYFKQATMLSLKLLRQIYLRDLRMTLFSEEFWYLDKDFSVRSVLPLLQQVEQAHEMYDDTADARVTPLFDTSVPALFTTSSLTSSQLDSVMVLTYIPYMVPFQQRAALFHALIEMDRTRIGGWFAPKTQGTVSRDNILFDAFEQFGTLPGEQFKRPLSVEFINKFGEKEAGIDGGGLTKELLTSLVNSAFIPSVENKSHNGGFEFFDTTSDMQLYPSADYFLQQKYALLHPEQTEYSAESREFTLQMLRFLGMVVAKCLYENVLIDVSFAPFFLNRWTANQGRTNFMGAPQMVEEGQRYRNSFDDLQSFDNELYQSLVKLLRFSKSQIDELDLTFTVTEKLGESTFITLNLVPNGNRISLTQENKLQYAYSVATYKLDQRINVQTSYFLDGLFQVIRPHWLSLFNPYELQTLISGGEREIDITDLQKNVVLGGYTTNDETIRYLFDILREFTAEQKTQFIKFVTSSSKQPLLGFKELSPKFGVRNSGSDPERLPTASTCVNLLKLPDYKNKELLRRKLLYSINAGAGFDLS